MIMKVAFIELSVRFHARLRARLTTGGKRGVQNNYNA